MAAASDGLGGSGEFCWSGRSVLVTGAQGFIGSWLTESLLEKGAVVTAVVAEQPARSRFVLEGIAERCNVTFGDLSSLDQTLKTLNEHEVTVCFHLAAQTIVGTARRSPFSTFESNVRGTYVLLEALRLNTLTEAVVVASSDKAYGAKEDLPYSESQSLTPQFPYDTSKACAEMIASSYAATYELPVAITRLANVYGGGDFNNSRLVPEVVQALLQGRAPVVRSDGSPERDFLYIDDAVTAYLTLAEATLKGEMGVGDAFNFGCGTPVPVREIVDRLCEISGLSIEPDIRGSGVPEAEIDRQWLDSTKAREQLPWQPTWSLDSGLQATYEWYRVRHPYILRSRDNETA